MTNDASECCRRAIGYLELGLPEEALAELDEATTATSQALQLRVEILFRLQRWNQAAGICVPMLEQEPGEPAWWIQAAYALRRARSVEEAEPILRAALDHHPDEVLILYNLACYACVQGRPDEARDLLARAIEHERAQVLLMAAHDPDLAAILPWIRAQSAGPEAP